MKKHWQSKFIWVIAVVLVLLMTAWLFSAAGNVEAGNREAGRQQLETALRRAAVACYAAEGIYPPTVEYLEQHYGIQIDRQTYHVFYEIFAENLMPQITVTLVN